MFINKFRILLHIIVFLLMIFSQLVSVNSGYAKLEIIIKPTPDWGPMSDTDIEILCQNVVDHFEKHLRQENQIDDSVNVYRTNVGHHFATLDISDPNVRYKIGIQPINPDGIDYKILDFFYLIQPFTHEFCHILQDQTKKLWVEDTQNLWLLEGIATMSSLWCLREMAKEWKNGSHFGVDLYQADGRVYNFSDSFNFFVDSWLYNTPNFQFDGTSAEWLEKYEDDLRKVSIKPKAGLSFVVPPEQLAFRLLPVFEESPEAWNIITKMPFSNGKISEYMQDWYDAVDLEDKQHVESIAKIMEITIDTSIPQSQEINADVNNDGYVDLYDVMIVRSGMTNMTTYDTDINNDGVTDKIDLWIVKAIAIEAITAAAPSVIRKNKLITKWAKLKQR